MASAEFRVSYEPEDHSHGLLCGSVRSGEFCGDGSAFFNFSELYNKFLPALRAYPLSVDEPPSLRGGVWLGEHHQPGLVETRFGFSLTQFNVAGLLLAQIELSENFGDTYAPILQSVVARFFVEYEELKRFADHFENLLFGRTTFAAMRGRTSQWG